MEDIMPPLRAEVTMSFDRSSIERIQATQREVADRIQKARECIANGDPQSADYELFKAQEAVGDRVSTASTGDQAPEDDRTNA